MREKNSAYNEIDHPSTTQGVIMAESPIETTETVLVPVEKTSRLKSFNVNHPRTAKIAGFTALTAAVLGTLHVMKNRRLAVVETETHDVEDSFDTSS